MNDGEWCAICKIFLFLLRFSPASGPMDHDRPVLFLFVKRLGFLVMLD